MSVSEKKGRPFERLAAAVQKKIDENSEVSSPFVVVGKSGSRITLDVAVQGTIGSTKILVAIEAKDYTEKVGVEQVRAFVTVIDDIRANRGIMVTPLGFTRDALLTAAHHGIETSILRRGEGKDWEGVNRALEMTITMMANQYLDAEVVLSDGRVIPVRNGGIHIFSDGEGKMVFFDRCVNGALSGHPELENKHITITPTEPLWEVNDGGERVAVAELRCRRVNVPGWTQSFLQTAPEDCVFAKLTPDGELDERQFFEFSDLEKLAEGYRSRPAT